MENIVHQKQGAWTSLCAVHALNNLLQNEGAVTAKGMDRLCRQLSPTAWINPHKSVWGVGDYDLDAIMEALRQWRLVLKWWDLRSDLNDLNFLNVYGIMLNVKKERTGILHSVTSFLASGRHWLTIKNFPRDGEPFRYMNLDSLLPGPMMIGEVEALKAFLRHKLQVEGAHVFIIITPQVDQNGDWKRNNN